MGIDEWKNIFTNIGAIVIGLILAIGQLSIVWKMNKNKKEKDDEYKQYGHAIKEENQFAIQIQEQLEELKESVNADRVQVIEFHNGTDFSTRKGYKLDCTYEVVKYGSASVKGIMKDYPTTLLPTFMKRIIEEKLYYVNNIENIHEEDMSTYVMKLNMDVKAFYDLLLEKNGTPIGILAVQFGTPSKLNQNEIAKMVAKKIIIENLL